MTARGWGPLALRAPSAATISPAVSSPCLKTAMIFSRAGLARVLQMSACRRKMSFIVAEFRNYDTNPGPGCQAGRLLQTDEPLQAQDQIMALHDLADGH